MTILSKFLREERKPLPLYLAMERQTSAHQKAQSRVRIIYGLIAAILTTALILVIHYA